MAELWVDPRTFDQSCLVSRVRKPGMVALSDYRERRHAVRMAQVAIETTRLIRCRFCSSNDVVKNGVRGGVQYYWCKSCRRKFSGNDALPGMRFAPDRIATALSLFYEGLSLNEIGRTVSLIYDDAQPSDSTVYEWVSRFTEQAIRFSRDVKARTGPVWAADETVLDVAGGRTKSNSPNTIWFWDVIDLDTRFLLASHLSWSRRIQDARLLFTRAAVRAERVPDRILTDHLAAYLDGIERTFGASAKHIQTGPFVRDADGDSTRAIERFHGTLKDRTKVMRGMHNRETAQLILDGWLIHYNYFRPHEGLPHGQTPGQAAATGFRYRNWRDIVLAEVPYRV